MKKVLITGGSGFIGAEIVSQLSARGDWEITVLDAMTEQIHGKAWDKSYLYRKIEGKCRFIRGSVTDMEAMKAAVAGQEYVIHLAAETGTVASQVMLLCGSDASGLEHPNWRENLALALYLQNAVNTVHPSLMRPVELVPQRYNQHLSSGSLILEVGSSGNTLQEALAAVRLFGEATAPALLALAENSESGIRSSELSS